MIPLNYADPITLTAIGTLAGGLAGVGGLAMNLFGSKAAPPATPAPTPPAMTPTGGPGTNKPAGGPSFLAAAAGAPNQQSTGTKTLLGQ